MRFKRGNFFSAFTLIELMVIVAIIALLIVLGVGIYLKNIPKANDARRKSDLGRIKIAIEEYEKDNNCYPPVGPMNQCGDSQFGRAQNPIEPYLKHVPCDPTTDSAYFYETDGLGCPRWFRLYAKFQSDDPDAIHHIGPGGAYDYYVSSGNDPPVVPQEPCKPKYGCKSGQCVLIDQDANCNPVCYPWFDTDYCGNPDNCKTAPECGRGNQIPVNPPVIN